MYGIGRGGAFHSLFSFLVIKSKTMSRDFLKMHGLGNDFVIIDGRKDGFLPDKDFCLRVADRHRGVGCDQLIVLAPPKNPKADLYMYMFNADASIVRACGNATRCVASLLFKETGKREGTIETIAGLLRVWREGEDRYAVDFGPPRLAAKEIPLAKDIDTLNVPFPHHKVVDACCVNMGNPHAVFFVPAVMDVPLERIGKKLEHDPLFPDRCNIEFAQILTRAHIRMRVWERGTGVTQACGSGACATMVAAVRRGLVDRKATVRLDGGDLVIEWREKDGHVILSGPASFSFKGTLDE